MPKSFQCHHQPGAPQKRSALSVNNHPVIVDIFQKFYKNGPSIQTISFRVTMVKSRETLKLEPGLFCRSKAVPWSGFVKGCSLF